MDRHKQFLYNREKYLRNLYHLCRLLGITEEQLLFMPKNELNSRLDALKDRFHVEKIARNLLAYREAGMIARKKLKGKCCSDTNLQKPSEHPNKNCYGQALANDIRNVNRVKGGSDDWIDQARFASRAERSNMGSQNDDIWSMLASVCCCKCDLSSYGYSPRSLGSSDPDISMRSRSDYTDSTLLPSRRRMSYPSPLYRNMAWRTRQDSYSPYTPESGWSRVPVDNIRTIRTPDDIIAAKRQERLLKAEGSPKARPGRRIAAIKKYLNLNEYPED